MDLFILVLGYSRGIMSSPERKPPKSVRRLTAKLLELLEQQQYETIDVRALCLEVGVARSTFYRRFAGRHDLLISALMPILVGAMRAAASNDPKHVELELAKLRNLRGCHRAFTSEVISSTINKRLAGELAGMALADPHDPYVDLTAHVLAVSFLSLMGRAVEQPFEVTGELIAELFSGLCCVSIALDLPEAAASRPAELPMSLAA